jgi:hypothetical protein
MRAPSGAQESREPDLRKAQQGCERPDGRVLEPPFLGSQNLGFDFDSISPS